MPPIRAAGKHSRHTDAAHLGALCRIPYACRPVGGEGSEHLVVRRESDRLDLVVVPVKHALFLAGLDIPDADRLIVAAGYQPFAVRAIGDRIDAKLMALQRADDGAGLRVANGN